MAFLIADLGVTGLDAYGVIYDLDANTVYNRDAAAWEAFNAANWDDYDWPMTEQGSTGRYVSDDPLSSFTPPLLDVVIRNRTGAGPAESVETDPQYASGWCGWLGSKFAAGGNVNLVAWAGTAMGIAAGPDTGLPLVSVQTFFDPGDAVERDVAATATVNLDRLDAAVSTRAAPGAAMTLAGNAVTAAALAADAVAEIQSGLATQASVNTIDDFLDTEVAAILAAVDTEVGSLVTAVAALPTAAENATAWGSRVVGTHPDDGNITADMLLAGWFPDFTQSADGLTFTLSTIAGTGTLAAKTFTRLATTVGGVRSGS
jgi:hypothetical protein